LKQILGVQMSKIRFEGRVALITGAGRGLGRAYAELLGTRGAKVVVNDPGGSLSGEGSDQRPAISVADAIRAAGGEAVANFDAVGSPGAAASMVGQAIEQFGRIDIIINNAGIFLPLHDFAETTTASFEAVFSVHTMGAIEIIRQAWPHMVGQSYGRIVNTGSSVGYYGTRGRLEYGVAKAALHGLTRCLSHESVDHGIHVNLIAPGALTRPGEERAGGNPPEALRQSFSPNLVAPIVAWLAHEDCKSNGQSYTSIAGTTTRIKIAETAGLGSDNPTIEDIRDYFDQIEGDDDLKASGLTFWENGEAQGMALIDRYGKRDLPPS
jgi:NAD(P)-dependent dehydrogenase (short-subunit alcohol dehydrogenase family)